MKGTKRVYASRSASRPAVKRLSVKKQLLRLKETKNAVRYTTTDTIAASGRYTQIVDDYSLIHDALEADRGMLVGMRIKGTFQSTSAVRNQVRVLILKNKRNTDIAATSLIWLDPNNVYGTPGDSATDVLTLEQQVAPVNKDGFVVKFDRTMSLSASDGGASSAVIDQYIPMKEVIQIFDDTAIHSANYFLCIFGTTSAGAACAALANVAVEVIFKDSV